MFEGILDEQYRKILRAHRWLKEVSFASVPGEEEVQLTHKALDKAQEALRSFVSNPKSLLEEVSKERQLQTRKILYEDIIFIAHKAIIEAANVLTHKGRQCSSKALDKTEAEIEHDLSKIPILLHDKYYEELSHSKFLVRSTWEKIQKSLQSLREAEHLLALVEHEYFRSYGLPMDYQLVRIIQVVIWPWALFWIVLTISLLMVANEIFYFKGQNVLNFVIPLISLFVWYPVERLILPKPGTWLTKCAYIFRYLVLPFIFGTTIAALWFRLPNLRIQLIIGAISLVLLSIPVIWCAVRVIFTSRKALIRCGGICDGVFVPLTQSE